MNTPAWTWTFVGDSALAVRVPDPSPLDANVRVHALAHAVRDAAIDGVRDVVPGMRDLVVHLDPRRCDLRLVERALARAAASVAERRAGSLRQAMPEVPPRVVDLVKVSVTFGGTSGPDLDDVGRACGLSAREVVRRLTASDYVVHFVGFLPGFPYLGPLDASLRLPRRPTPRPRVPAGAVAIAGEYAGIYPWESPGGWHLVGRTDLILFDPARLPPAVLAPGMRVRLIDADA